MGCLLWLTETTMNHVGQQLPHWDTVSCWLPNQTISEPRMLLEDLLSFSGATVAEALGIEVEREDLEAPGSASESDQQFWAHEQCLWERNRPRQQVQSALNTLGHLAARPGRAETAEGRTGRSNQNQGRWSPPRRQDASWLARKQMQGRLNTLASRCLLSPRTEGGLTEGANTSGSLAVCSPRVSFRNLALSSYLQMLTLKLSLHFPSSHERNRQLR